MISSGALGASFLPFWVNWIRLTYPETELCLVLTRSAERFVSREALTMIANRTVLQDTWPDEPEPGALHVELAHWADATVVYPATLHFVSRLALGLADTPALLALQCMPAPIGLAPSLPPGAERFSNYSSHIKALEQRGNVAIAPPHPGRSATTGRTDASAAAPLPVLLEMVEQLRPLA